MIPWTLIEDVTVPGSTEQMRLYKRGDEYSIRVANYELMNSRAHGSEEALAELAFDKLGAKRKLRVLIGGLGMGYTLAAVLRGLVHGGEAVVAELVPAVVAWNRGPLSSLAGNPLRDKRARVYRGDVTQAILDEKVGFDAILLDVDNGPEALTLDTNHRLYGLPGLRAAHAALRPGGVLAIWFVRRLRQCGFEVEEVRARARTGRGGARYVVWVAQRK